MDSFSTEQVGPQIELLAPAGTLPAFEAALQEGADAVYVGAPGLNARALARDFTFREIAAMTEYAHAAGKKIYVAMNSLLKEEETEHALASLQMLNEIKPDALILQDVGVLSLLQRFCPDLEVHASTLMTVHNSAGAQALADQGFQRVVLARELELEEIKTIQRRCSVALEIFIHGAMCFSYSGLCRFSSLHGGKSSLRGQCVQPCRRRYEWLPSGKRQTSGHLRGKAGYFFSMNDLCGLEHLAALRDAGVVSLKIEGRLKSVEYVRHTVRAYRLALTALDAPGQEQKKLLKEARRSLDAGMGRKRTTGFFLGGPADDLIIPGLSGNTGEMVGKITELISHGPGKRNSVLKVLLKTGIQRGDRLRLYDERTGERESFTLHAFFLNGTALTQAKGGQTIEIPYSGNKLRASGRGVTGFLFRVDVSGRKEKPGKALLQRLASIPEHRFTIQPGSVSPDAVSPTAASHRGAPAGQGSRAGGGPQWWVQGRNLDILTQRYPFAVARYLIELSPQSLEHLQRKRRVRPETFIWALPPVIIEKHVAWYEKAINWLQREGFTSFQVAHLGQVALVINAASGAEPLALYGDYSCNVLNAHSLQHWATMGFQGVQFQLEADRSTFAQALHRFHADRKEGQGLGMQVGCYVYGHPPLFTSRMQGGHFQGHRSLVSVRNERFYLDRGEEVLYVRAHMPFSLLPYVRELTRIGVEYFVVDLSQGNLKKTCAEVVSLLSQKSPSLASMPGNFAGTLL